MVVKQEKVDNDEIVEDSKMPAVAGSQESNDSSLAFVGVVTPQKQASAAMQNMYANASNSVLHSPGFDSHAAMGLRNDAYFDIDESSLSSLQKPN